MNQWERLWQKFERGKRWACRMDDDSERKKAKGSKKVVLKGELMFENYKDGLFNGTVI